MTMNDRQLEMLKAETLDQPTGAALKILEVTPIFAAIVLEPRVPVRVLVPTPDLSPSLYRNS
jgi:hypothetical protein